MRKTQPDADFRRALIDEAPYLRRFARSLVGDVAAADDLVQETLLRAIKRFDLYDRGRALRPWLFRILRNLTISQYRQADTRGTHVSLTEVEGTLPTPLSSQYSGLVLRDINRALDQLPFDQREVLVLVALEGLKYREVVDVLDVPIGTVMSRLSRARERLRQLLDLPEYNTIRRVK